MLRGTTLAVLLVGVGLMPVALRVADSPVPPKAEAAKEVGKGEATTATTELRDAWITMHTKIALLADERISSTDVSVKTQKGVIALHGTMASEQARQAAADIARTIEGAKKVTNGLVVVSTATRTAVDRQDDQIVTEVAKGITADASLKKAAVAVRAERGSSP
jgi:hyperosmotically inducible periplasmic protein